MCVCAVYCDGLVTCPGCSPACHPVTPAPPVALIKTVMVIEGMGESDADPAILQVSLHPILIMNRLSCTSLLSAYSAPPLHVFVVSPVCAQF